MKCPKCQFENPDDAKFCNECANKFELICPECGKSNPPGSKFCNECAKNLSLPSEPTPKDLSFDEKLDKIQRYLPKGLTEKILAETLIYSANRIPEIADDIVNIDNALK